MRLIAERAFDEKTGARGLVSAIEKVLLPFEKSLPSTKLRHLIRHQGGVVLDPADELKRMLSAPEDAELRHDFERFVEEEKIEVRKRTRRPDIHPRSQPARLHSPKAPISSPNATSGRGSPSMTSATRRSFSSTRSGPSRTTITGGTASKSTSMTRRSDEIIARALEGDRSASAICLEISRDFDYGFKLIMDRSGQTHFLAAAPGGRASRDIPGRTDQGNLPQASPGSTGNHQRDEMRGIAE